MINKLTRRLPDGRPVKILINPSSWQWAQETAKGTVTIMMLDGPEIEVDETLETVACFLLPK